MLYAEFLMMLVGIALLVMGSIQLRGKIYLDGWRLRAVAAFLILPLPLTLLTAFIFAQLIARGTLAVSSVALADSIGQGLLFGGLAGSIAFGLFLPARPIDNGDDSQP